MRFCECPQPRPSADPRKNGACVCGFPIDYDAEWVVNDKTHNAFLNRVEQALAAKEGWPSEEPPPPDWLHYRRLALERERAGRERFGFSYLTRDNIVAGAEESTDGVNYTYFDTMQALKDGYSPDFDLILTAAYHDFMAYRARLHMRARRLGSP